MKQSKTVNRLAGAFAVIARDESTMSSRADAVLKVVRQGGIAELKAFNKAVIAAYRENGWNARPGRRKEGAASGNAVPPTVKQYVSLVRAAFRAKLAVGTFKSFYELRKAVRDSRLKGRKRRGDPRLAGLTVIKGGALTGAPFHDLTVLYGRLEKGDKDKLAGAVMRLVKQYQPVVAPLTLLKAA